jgi:hypothetical protein
MKRRIVLATCLAGIIAGSAGAALATPGGPVDTKKHDVCIAIAQNDNYHSADYYCVGINPPSPTN